MVVVAIVGPITAVVRSYTTAPRVETFRVRRSMSCYFILPEGEPKSIPVEFVRDVSHSSSHLSPLGDHLPVEQGDIEGSGSPSGRTGS